MKFLLKGAILGGLLLAAVTAAGAAQLGGTVVAVSGLDVTVQVAGELMPAVGDRMEISFELPGGESLSIGTWKITKVSGNLASASVVAKTGTPVTGQTAVIFSENPTPASTPDTRTVTQNNSGAAVVSTAGLSEDARKVVDQLRSSDVLTKRDGAKIACRSFADNATVVAVAAEELEKGYTGNMRDDYQVDAMAWLCRVLGESGDEQYYELLKKVYRKCRSKKVRRYAKTNLALLR